MDLWLDDNESHEIIPRRKNICSQCHRIVYRNGLCSACDARARHQAERKHALSIKAQDQVVCHDRYGHPHYGYTVSETHEVNGKDTVTVKLDHAPRLIEWPVERVKKREQNGSTEG